MADRHPSRPMHQLPYFDNKRNSDHVKLFLAGRLRTVDTAIIAVISLIDDIRMKEKAEDQVCCTPENGTAPTEFRALEGPEADEELAKLAKAIGHPARVRIIRMLSRKEARVCSQIVDELPLAQSTVSEHLRILKEAGLVRSSQDGPRVGYCINFDTLRKLKALIAII